MNLLLTMLCWLIIAKISEEEMLPSCHHICNEKEWASSSSHQRMCYGGDCLYLSDSYDKLAHPDMGTGEAYKVHFCSSITTVSNVDVVEGTYEVEMRIRLMWEDNRMMACQCQERGNKKAIKISGLVEDKIWIPDIELVDVLDVKYELESRDMGGVVLVPHDLSVGVHYDVRLGGVMACDFETNWFPYDNNVCLLRFGSNVPKSSMTIVMDELPVLRVKKVGDYELEVMNLTEKERRCPFQSRYIHGEVQCFGVALGFKREYFTTNLEATAISLVLVLMTIFTVILSRSDRLGTIGATLLGALTVYYTFSLELPDKCTPRTCFVLAGLAICFTALLQSVVRMTCLRRHRDWVDKVFLVIGVLSGVLTPLMVWNISHLLADNVCEGKDEVCYQNRYSS